MKHHFLRNVLTAAATLAVATSTAQSSAASQPNIILFLVDDMGWQDTSLPLWTKRTSQNNLFQTPNMQRLAARGMMFTQAYASAISSPSRCSLITGANAARHKVTNWTMERDKTTDLPHEGIVLPDWNVNGVSPSPDIPQTFHATPLPEVLRSAGYHTILCGKAHFGALDTPGADPLNMGFDVNIAGHAAGGLATYLSEQNYGHRPDGTPYALNAIPGLEKYWGTGTFATEALTREAIDALKDAAQNDAPFFLYMSHYAVHIPIDRDARFYPKYEAMGLDPREAAYASLVEGMDKSLGDLLDWIDSNNLTDNTIILFMSDNGGLATQPEWRAGEMNTQNAPLKSGKGSLHEGGIRVPLIVAWPGVTKPASTTDAPVIIEDIFPTLLEMADITLPHVPQTIDGRNFLPVLKGKRTKDAKRMLVWNFPNVWGNEGPAINLCCAIRQGDWKLIYHYDTGQRELYNIANDIGETHNLSATNRRIANRLANRLGSYLRRAGAQRPSFNNGTPCPWPDEKKQ